MIQWIARNNELSIDNKYIMIYACKECINGDQVELCIHIFDLIYMNSVFSSLVQIICTNQKNFTTKWKENKNRHLWIANEFKTTQEGDSKQVRIKWEYHMLLYSILNEFLNGSTK
jgi:hypothetical protein